MVLLAALLVSGAVVWAGLRIAAAVQASRPESLRARALQLTTMFAPGIRDAAGDPRAILVWQPLARIARQMFPDEFALIERSADGAFPFNADRLQSAHAQWTSDWLAWERSHDTEYKLKAAVVEQEMAVAGATPVLRARLDAVESEKLDLYQRRYQEYVRVAKALHALTAGK